jgi:hypothetical protein
MIAFLSSITMHTTSFILDSYLAYSSTLTVEATYSSETSVEVQRTTWRYIPEDRTLQQLFRLSVVLFNYYF